jgi:GT2 family glycosyltransferase
MISAVIPVYGDSPWLENCIKSLAVDEIIVVDDASPEPCVIPEVRVHRRRENGGFGAACNDGAKLAHGDYLLFVNSDVELLPGCIDAMLAASTEKSIVGAKLLYPDNRIQHGGVYYVPSTGWFDHRYRGRASDYAPASRTEHCLVTGALLLIPKAFFMELHGFDTSFRMSFEDIDLCMRALRAGGEVIYCGSATAYHVEGATRGSTPKRKAQLKREWSVWEEESKRRFNHRYSQDELQRASAR